MPIAEPMTLLTDWLLAGGVFFFGIRLAAVARRKERISVRLWSAGFIFSAVAAFTGGAFHGFSLVFPSILLKILWKITVYSVGTAGFFLAAGTVISAFSGSTRKFFLMILGAKAFAYAVWMAFNNDFRYVVLDYAPSLLLILFVQFLRLQHRRNKGAGLVILGVLLSFAAAYIQRSGVILHEHFNHNDLYHVVQLAAFWLLYRGGRRMPDAA